MTNSPLCCRCRVNPRQHPSNAHCRECRNAYQSEARRSRRVCECGEKLEPYARKCEQCKSAKRAPATMLCEVCEAVTSRHPGKKWCEGCRVVKEREAAREATRRRDRKRTEAARAAGKLCSCGARLPSLRQKSCAECRKQRRYWKHKANLNRRRALKKGSVVGPVSYKQVWENGNGQCGLCGVPVTRGTGHVDHIIALARGGPHRQENLQLLCAPCNQAKGAA